MEGLRSLKVKSLPQSTIGKVKKKATKAGAQESAMQYGRVRNVTSKDQGESSVEIKKRTSKSLTKREKENLVKHIARWIP